MANYKRGKCRRHCPRAIRGSTASWRARHGLDPLTREWPSHLNPMSSYPAWWDRMFHNRPTRAKARRLERAIFNGADADSAVWPHPKRPHIYYW